MHKSPKKRRAASKWAQGKLPTKKSKTSKNLPNPNKGIAKKKKKGYLTQPTRRFYFPENKASTSVFSEGQNEHSKKVNDNESRDLTIDLFKKPESSKVNVFSEGQNEHLNKGNDNDTEGLTVALSKKPKSSKRRDYSVEPKEIFNYSREFSTISLIDGVELDPPFPYPFKNNDFSRRYDKSYTNVEGTSPRILLKDSTVKRGFQSKGAFKDVEAATHSGNTSTHDDATMPRTFPKHTNQSFRSKGALKDLTAGTHNRNTSTHDNANANQSSSKNLTPPLAITFYEDGVAPSASGELPSQKNKSLVPLASTQGDGTDVIAAPIANETQNIQVSPSSSKVDDIVEAGARLLLNYKHSSTSNDNQMCCLHSYSSKCPFAAEAESIYSKIMREYFRKPMPLQLHDSAYYENQSNNLQENVDTQDVPIEDNGLSTIAKPHESEMPYKTTIPTYLDDTDLEKGSSSKCPLKECGEANTHNQCSWNEMINEDNLIAEPNNDNNYSMRDMLDFPESSTNDSFNDVINYIAKNSSSSHLMSENMIVEPINDEGHSINNMIEFPINSSSLLVNENMDEDQQTATINTTDHIIDFNLDPGTDIFMQENMELFPSLTYSALDMTLSDTDDLANVNDVPPINSNVDDVAMAFNLQHSLPLSKNITKTCCLEINGSGCQFEAENDTVSLEILQTFLQQQNILGINESAGHRKLCNLHSFLIQNSISWSKNTLGEKKLGE